MINDRLAKFKHRTELIDNETPLAKELVYSMKLNFWMHEDPRKIRVSKL